MKHGEKLEIDLISYASKIRGWNAAFKVSFAVLLMILCIGLNNPYVSAAVIIGMAYLIVVKGGLSVREYLLVLAIPISFILLATITIAVDFAWKPIGQYNLHLGFFYIFTSLEKLEEAIFMILKVFAAVSALQMMTLSTPSSEIISVMRKAHIPKLIIELMNMIYRYIFIILDVYSKIKNSADSRQGFCDFKTSLHTFGGIASNMLVISVKKANGYYDAMEARCYDGEMIFLEEDKKITMIQFISAAMFISVLFLIWGFTK
ncbi:cobalt ECF transporter T component CbiQ [Desulfosporosinus acididurans]|uniref:cobalt ECF transporter T component CbiQ n=1 Tax=Desulfosporosinus acididurans TaxID=476652 RepID=UPI0006495E1D|nr:cobalt ECF transporter T component CbiQ [Desulfosporosinus acididurans]